MELTNGVLARFVGGQVAIDNGRRWHFSNRGELAAAAVSGAGDRAELLLAFKWRADQRKAVHDKNWVVDTRPEYRAWLCGSVAEELEGGKVRVGVPFNGEWLTFFPPDYPTNIQPTDVDGL